MKRKQVVIVLVCMMSLIYLLVPSCTMDFPPFFYSLESISPNTELVIFEDAAEWIPKFGKVSNDKNNFRSGTQSILQSSDHGGVVDARRTVKLNFEAAPRLRIRVYFHDTPTKIAVLLSSREDFHSYFMASVAYPEQALQKGWNIIDFYPESWEVNAGEDWSNTMIGLRIRIEPKEGEVAPRVSWDKMVVNADGIPGVMINFDDGFASVYYKAFQHMKNINARGTVYVITDRIGNNPGYLTLDQLLVLNAKGWSIANHSSSHARPFTKLPMSEVENQLRDAKNVLDTWGLPRASTHVAYPWGNWNAAVIDVMVSTGMQTGRTVENLHQDVWTSNGQNYLISTRYVNPDHTLDQVKSWVDQASRQQRIIGLSFHDIVDSDKGNIQWLTEDFIALIDYIHEKDIPFLTINDYYDIARTNALPIEDHYHIEAMDHLLVSAPGVTENDHFLEKVDFEIVLENDISPEAGKLILNNDGSFSYQPSAGWSGEAGFQYRICTQKWCTEPANVTISKDRP